MKEFVTLIKTHEAVLNIRAKVLFLESTAQSKKPRVVRGSGHAHVAMSKLVLVIVAETESAIKLVHLNSHNDLNPYF